MLGTFIAGYCAGDASEREPQDLLAGFRRTTIMAAAETEGSLVVYSTRTSLQWCRCAQVSGKRIYEIKS